MTNGSYKVRRCSIPRRASTVEAAHIHKLCQYMSTPVAGEQFRGSVRNVSAAVKSRLRKSLKAEVTSVQRWNDK